MLMCSLELTQCAFLRLLFLPHIYTQEQLKQKKVNLIENYKYQ